MVKANKKSPSIQDRESRNSQAGVSNSSQPIKKETKRRVKKNHNSTLPIQSKLDVAAVSECSGSLS